MPWYISDYQSDTAHLNPPQDSAYRRLLEHQWKTRKPLTGDILALINITKMTPHWVDASSIAQAFHEQASSIGRASASKDERMLYAWVLDLMNQFFRHNPDGTWTQPRLESELAKWGEKSAQAKDKAARAAWCRWHPKEPFPGDAPSITKGITQAMPKQCPSPSPVSTNTKAHSVRFSGDKLRGSGEESPIGPETSDSANDAANGSGKGAERLSTMSPRGEATRRKRKASRDARFESFMGVLKEYWAEHHPESPNYPWSARDDVSLSAMLDADKDLGLEEFTALLVIRAASKVSPSALIYGWVKDIRQYQGGPLDEYKKPLALKQARQDFTYGG